ncbi:glycerol-3-phosphate 1-O-acyltransferase PlsY [Pontibaca salina]|uniref:Glycerol-3-phosphate acyltransferase n=1 Tax=Pontibaca salina TaxID=2795731 RepID=A0A934HJI1_9RHOB|nr:glycerol-3-phosphate 1-O-acyltransferase PlsY [Pontibaca salina]MBI6629329.1 glycerol-3-phosphate 1-O-acyltransferase PlsY [Pontibaca salina]
MPPFETSAISLILWALAGYGLGSISFGLILARLMNLGDLRTIGSGNTGATNVLRTGSKSAAALTLLLDAAKGAAAVLLARVFAGEDAAQLAGLAAFFGHCWPVWARFRGGKGVATFLGLWLALAWPVGVACCLTWAATAALTRISSAGALGAAAASIVWVLVLGPINALVLAVVLAALVFWRHSANIARLRDGTEPRIGQRD